MSECSPPTAYTDIVRWVERHRSKSGQLCSPFARKAGRWHAVKLCVQFRVERGYLHRVGDRDSTVAGLRLKVRREAAAARVFFCNAITARGCQPRAIALEAPCGVARAEREMRRDGTMIGDIRLRLPNYQGNLPEGIATASTCVAGQCPVLCVTATPRSQLRSPTLSLSAGFERIISIGADSVRKVKPPASGTRC
jgi:hypothetical protein